MSATTYRANRRRMAWLAFMAFFAAITISNTQTLYPGTEREWVIGLAGLGIAVAVGVFAWMASLRLTLSPGGLSYRSMLGSRDIAWPEVEKLYWYDRGWVLAHGIPVSLPDLHVDVVMKDGTRLRLGDSFADSAEVVTQVIERTRPHLYSRMLADLNRGAMLDLGAVRISHASGVELESLFGDRSFRFEEIARYGPDGDQFRIWRTGGGSQAVPIDRVAKVDALMDVIEAVHFGARKPPPRLV